VQANIITYGKEIQQVDKFKYLGRWITADLEPEEKGVHSQIE